MYLDADELRPCLACGAKCDGDVCDQWCADALQRREEERERDEDDDEDRE